MVEERGFLFVDEGQNLGNGFRRHKFGYLAMQPGSVLGVELDSTLQGTAEDEELVRSEGLGLIRD